MADIATDPNALYSARQPSAYASRWQYENRAVEGVALDSTLTENFSSSFDTTVTASSFSSIATASPNAALIQSGIVALTSGNGVRVRLSVSLTPSPLTAGNVRVNIMDTDSFELLVSGSANATGVIDITYIAEGNRNVMVDIILGSQEGGTDWNAGESVEATLSIESFPPALRPIIYYLNPAIPWHRIALAIPDQSFACIAHLRFMNGGSEQSVLDIPLGPPQGRFYATPPSKALQSSFWTGVSPDQLLLLNGKVVNQTAPGATVSTYAACFEWSAVADELRIEFSSFVGDPSSVFAGIMQYPQA